MFARRRQRPFRVALVVGIGLILVAGLDLCYLVLDPPPVDDLYAHTAAVSSMVYDRHGRLLFEMPPPYTGRHSPVSLNQIPVALRQAVIATEDASFYENPGLDVAAIVRALWINLQGGELLSGGSTITQQLARNLLLDPGERYERTLSRKLREALLAWRLARHYSKDEILELYLNEVYFGNLAYGAEAASQAYFGKHVQDLDLAECSMLAGLIQAPSLYNPLENLRAARARQSVVLDLMIKQGYTTPAQAQLAKLERIHFVSAQFPIRAPHFVMYVRSLLEQELGLERLEQGGLHIHTSLDLDLNETARDLVRHHLSLLAACSGEHTRCPPGGHNVRNAALVALDPRTGEILAMVGSPDYFSARIDGAVNGTTALRQPGSSIKPITYAAAFEQGTVTAATMMLDVRTSFLTREGAPYVPLNYDLQSRGPVRLREALASSYNVIAVKVLDTIGVPAMTSLARRLGITALDDPDRLGLAVTLGGGEVRLLELTAAYSAFANGGYAVQPIAVRRVVDETGRVLLTSSAPGVDTAGTPALDERVAYLITDILSDDTARLASFGEGSALELTRPAAVKTGTTTDFRDNWTVGYTPELIAGVWIGNADNEPMWEISGVSGAAPIWHDFMEAALKGRPVSEFERPDGLVRIEVCALSGLLPGPDCPHRVVEWFLEGTVPTERCTMHRRIAIDRANGLRASPDTPPEQVMERVYTLLPPEALEWARAHGIPQPPHSTGEPLGNGARTRSSARAQDGSALVMTSPDAGTTYRQDPGLPADAQQILVSVQTGAGFSMKQVTLRVDGQALATFHAPPYRVLWQLEPGKHSFSAVGVTDSGGAVSSAEVEVEVRD